MNNKVRSPSSQPSNNGERLTSASARQPLQTGLPALGPISAAFTSNAGSSWDGNCMTGGDGAVRSATWPVSINSHSKPTFGGLLANGLCRAIGTVAFCAQPMPASSSTAAEATRVAGAAAKPPNRSLRCMMVHPCLTRRRLKVPGRMVNAGTRCRRRKVTANCDYGARCASKKRATSEW